MNRKFSPPRLPFGHLSPLGRGIVVAFILILPLTRTSLAEEQEIPLFNKDDFIASAKNREVLKISLVDCIMYAFKKNTDIKIQEIEPKLRKDDVKIAESVFDPTFNLDYLLYDSTKLSPVPFLSGDIKSKTQEASLNADVSGKIPFGTSYSIDFLNSRLKSNSKYQDINPAYEVEPKITVSQPLLRGAGTFINRAEIIIAQNNMGISEEVFKNTVMDIITSAKIAYYNYIYALEGYKIAKSYLKRTVELLRINRQRYNKGLISSVDLLETEAAVADRKKILIYAETNLKKAEDNLKLIVNLVDDPKIWNARLVLTDKPEFNIQKVDLMESLINAFQYRPDYEAKKIELENCDIRIRVTKNALLPTLDLLGSFGLNGLGEDYSDALDSLSSEYKDWTVGVELNIPWGSENRAQHDKAKLEKVQALISFKKLEQNIILEVRDKVRDVDFQYRQVQAAKIANEKEDENYKAQRERYSAGQVSTHDMLDYQYKLAQSELDYKKALIDYNIALFNLDKAEGLTLAKNNIKMEE